jgi:AraC-like DNA-binding protein/mannose-6-phosphate isomerase-like protein (cupin superfamily)
MSMVFAPEQDMATRLWFYQAEEICLHSFRYSAGKVECLPHTHDEYNIVICLAGEIDCVIAEDHQTLSPGEVLVVNPGEVHYASYPKEPVAAVGITLHVPESAMHRTIRRMRLPLDLEASSLSFVGKAKDPALLQFADELIAELDERQNGFEMVTQALVIQLIVHLLRRCLSPVVHTPRRVLPRQLPSWQMVRAFEYMNACGKSEFKLSDLCTTAGTSASRFIQLFKNSVSRGQSPHEVYNQLLMSKAKRFLANPASSVKEVSFELGFQNESHFCRVFRSYTGTTPGSYRLSLQ